MSDLAPMLLRASLTYAILLALLRVSGRRSIKATTPFDLIVSLQAVHELRHASRIPKLYAQFHSLLVPGGTILICDHVNSSSPSGQRAAHFMTVEEHLSTFKKAGFINAREICPAADLSLMAAEKP